VHTAASSLRCEAAGLGVKGRSENTNARLVAGQALVVRVSDQHDVESGIAVDGDDRVAIATVCIEGDRGELRSGVRGRSGLTDVIAIQRDVGAETRDIDEPDLRIRDVESIAKR